MIVNGKQKVYKLKKETFHCGTAITMRFIGGKWKCIILWYLRNEPKRFSELKKLIPDITEKMLSLQLKALQKDKLIKRKVYGKKPPIKVVYSLTDFGKSLLPTVEAITNWGIHLGETKGELIDIIKI
jgi:DNA-binding HxlR family transcriptional regulator